MNRLGIECVENKIQRLGRLRWFGHVERKEENNWVKKCTRMNVTWSGGSDGAPRKTWQIVVSRGSVKAMGIIGGTMAQDRCAWRNSYW